MKSKSFDQNPNGRRLVELLISACFGVLCHWRVKENGLFWQVRAGQEILSTGHVQTHDTWSSTVLGTDWYNFQWLSCVIMALAAKVAPAYYFLPTLRSLLVFLVSLLFFRWLRILGGPAERDWPHRVWFSAVFFIVVSGRFQMRPELFTLGIFIWMLTLLHDPSKTYRQKIFGGLASLVLWANFHGGTFLLGYLVFSSFALFGKESSRSTIMKGLGWAGIGFLCWFVTPTHFHVVKMFMDLGVHYDPSITPNQDQQPLQLYLFQPRFGGTVFTQWVLFCFVGLLLVFKNRDRFAMAAGTPLVVASLARVRARGFSFLFFVPTWMELIRSSRIPKFLTVSLIVIECGILLPWHMKGAPKLGFGIETGRYPVASAEFVRKTGAQGRLFNFFDFGSYLVGNLPEHPVSTDTRESIFVEFLKSLKEARTNPLKFRRFMDGNHFDIVIDNNLASSRVFFQEFYPQDSWFLVFEEPAARVYLRDTPENAGIIRGYKMHL